MADADMAKLFSRVLSYAIVGGSFSLKLPQIIKIVKAGSTEGVSDTTTVMELFIFMTSYYYGLRKNLELMTYAESGICGVQVLILLGMIMVYNGKLASPVHLLVLIGAAAYSYAFLNGQFDNPHPALAPYTKMPILEILFMSLIPLGVCSRIPQIIAFHKAKSTGNAAFLTWFLAFGGACARVITTFTLVNDPLMLTSFALNALAGGIIVLQFFIYWNSPPKKEKQN